MANLARLDTVRFDKIGDTSLNRFGWIMRGGRDLVETDASVFLVEQSEVGKGAADINANSIHVIALL
jgi:hypothetical protein